MSESHNSLHESLEWLPYHGKIVECLKQVDPGIWNWFSKSAVDPKSAEEVKFALLKSTYRVDPDTQPALYEAVGNVATRLGISAPVTIYQSQNAGGLNASLAYVPDHVHLILHGPVTEKLTPVEIRALFGHELAHYLLFQARGGELLVAAEMLRALTNDAHAHSAHLASLRLLDLYSEVYCDRAAFLVTGDLHAVVSMLLKVETGIQEVSAEGYLRQADEIFAHGAVSTDGITHPEGFIRARSIQLWAERSESADLTVAEMIEGQPGIEDLDLLTQQQVSEATRRVLDVLLCHQWFQTDPVLAHARLFFENYVPPAAELADGTLASDVRTSPDSLRDYYCFLLLDFVAADRDLEEAPLAAALTLAEQLDMKDRFLELARRELRLRKNQIEKIDQQKQTILADANRAAAASP